MKYKKRLFLVVNILFLCSCQSYYDKLKNKIIKQEKLIKEHSIFNKVEGKKLYDLYAEFIEKYPNDSSIASVHFQAGKLSLLLNDPILSKMHFLEIVSKHSGSRFMPEAMVYIGFIEENINRNTPEAEKWYQTFLIYFPDHPMAHDIKINLELLKKSSEELNEYLKHKISSNE